MLDYAVDECDINQATSPSTSIHPEPTDATSSCIQVDEASPVLDENSKQLDIANKWSCLIYNLAEGNFFKHKPIYINVNWKVGPIRNIGWI